MSLTYAGGYAIDPSSSTGPSSAGKAGQIARCAAGIIGSTGEVALAIAIEGVMAGLRDVNLRGPFLFGTEVQADVPLVSGQANYATPKTNVAARALQLINSDGKVHRTLGFVPWEHRNMATALQDQDGEPVAWTQVNSWANNEVEVWPTPDDSAATDLELRIVNVKRIPLVTGPDTVIIAPEDFYIALCYYTEFYLAERRLQDNPRLAERKYAQYLDAVKRAKANDREENVGGSFQLRVARPDGFTVGSH